MFCLCERAKCLAVVGLIVLFLPSSHTHTHKQADKEYDTFLGWFKEIRSKCRVTDEGTNHTAHPVKTEMLTITNRSLPNSNISRWNLVKYCLTQTAASVWSNKGQLTQLVPVKKKIVSTCSDVNLLHPLTEISVYSSALMMTSHSSNLWYFQVAMNCYIWHH